MDSTLSLVSLENLGFFPFPQTGTAQYVAESQGTFGLHVIDGERWK